MGAPRASSALADLRAKIAGSLVVEPSVLLSSQGDASHLRGVPLGSARPEGEDDVVQLVGWARRWRVPLVARGGGTSLDGESVPADGAMVVDFSGWVSPLEVDPEERRARVGPGVVNRELQRAAGSHGLFFPPNPGSWTTSTIAGNVSTNASGPRSYRYGPTRSWTLGGRLVLGTGEVVELGTGSRKRSAGPEPMGYLVGSEGTLGLFTEVIVRLAPLPERRTALVVPVRDDAHAVQLARALDAQPKLALAAIEFLDRDCAAALSRESPRWTDTTGPLVLLESESTIEEEERRLTELSAALKVQGVDEDPGVFPNADDLWTLRGKSGAVLDREFGPRVREDVAVPLPRLQELFQLIHRLSKETGVPVWVYGHLGDGHLHPNYGVDPASPMADRLRRELWDGVRDLDGTISAEHGIGRLKRDAVRREHPRAVFDWMEAVKRSCDPDGILNPGKLYPDPDARVGVASSGSPSGSEGRGAPPG